MASSSCSVLPVASRPEDGEQQQGIAATVANHYNELRETGRAARSNSRIFHMRSFNNWIKSVLIGEAISQAKRVKENDRDRSGVTVLDIGCGKGGDLRKYLIGRIGHLICTDIAQTSLDQLRQRYNEIRDRNKFTIECMAADSTRDRLRDKYQNPGVKVDLVSVQFVLHYSFESLTQAETMLRNISENLKVGGFWIGTTTDASELVKRARDKNSVHFGNEVYSVTFQDETVLHPDQRIPLFGYKYDFHLDECVNCPEFLLHFPTLEHMALKYGLRRVMKRNFADYFDDNMDSESAFSLLKRMKGLEFVNRRNGSSRMTTTLGEYDHAEDWMNDEGKEVVLTLSRSEWEAITLYCIFAFQKFRDIGDDEDEEEDSDRSDREEDERREPDNDDDEDDEEQKDRHNRKRHIQTPGRSHEHKRQRI